MKSGLIKVDPEIMSGIPCFAGTRVPVKTLFLADFPTVTSEQAHQLLGEAKARVLAVVEE